MLRTPLCIAVALILPALAGARTAYAAESSARATPSLSVENDRVFEAAASVTAATKPAFSLAGGVYAAAQSVTLTDTTPGFVIHYTTNGAAPTAASPQYKAPIRVASTETIKAIAVAAGHGNSPVASATYRIAATGIVATPASLTFPVVNIGAKTVTRAVSFKNTGNTAVTSLSVDLAGAAKSAYSRSQTCGTTLAAGASCTVSVTFDPKTSGDLPASLRVTGSSLQSASVSIDGLCTDVTAAAPDGNTYLFDTTQGKIYVALRPDVAPKNVANFLHYVNNGTYRHSLFHRVVAGFVNQGGGYKLTSPGQPSASPTVSPVVNEFKLPNIRGTLAMAKLGNNPNSATDQFFFNVVNNTALDTQDGGFTVIGQIMGVQGVDGASQAQGLAVMDAINSDKVYDFGPPFDTIPLLNYKSGATVEAANTVDVNSITQVKASAGSPAMPVFSIKTGTYKGPRSIHLKDSTPGATIYYYLFGSSAHNVMKYTGPFTVAKTQYVSAYAVAPGYPDASSLNYEHFEITAP